MTIQPEERSAAKSAISDDLTAGRTWLQSVAGGLESAFHEVSAHVHAVSIKASLLLDQPKGGLAGSAIKATAGNPPLRAACVAVFAVAALTGYVERRLGENDGREAEILTEEGAVAKLGRDDVELVPEAEIAAACTLAP